MNGNWASYPKVSLSLVFKNPTKEDSYLYYATPGFAEKAFRGVRSEYSVIRCEFQFTDYFLRNRSGGGVKQPVVLTL
jgi:hypothetical protein